MMDGQRPRQEKVNFVLVLEMVKPLPHPHHHTHTHTGRALISSLHTYRSNKITRVFRWFSHAPCSGPYV